MPGGRPDASVVTGVAVTSGLAPDAEDTWTALCEGRSGIRHLGEGLPADVDLPTRIGEEASTRMSMANSPGSNCAGFLLSSGWRWC